MKKRNLIALLMAVCMIFSLLPVNAIAAGGEDAAAEETLLSENGNDPAPAGDSDPAGDETPAESEERAADEPAAADGESDAVPLKVVEPDEGYYLTYTFTVDGAVVSQQIVTDGDTLYRPASPEKEGSKFIGWYIAGTDTPLDDSVFGTVSGVTATAEITVEARFDGVLYVFFVDQNGRVVLTKESKSGESVSTVGVTYGLESPTLAVTGWYFDAGCTQRADTVELTDANVFVYAKVEEGHWLTFDSAGGTYYAPVFYTPETATKDPGTPTRPGYTFAGWYNGDAAFTFGGTLTGSVTLTAHWTANANTQYTVIHWQENANDEEFSFAEAETKTGATGSQTRAAAKSYTGFTAQTVTQQTIAGDGSTVVNVYYKRNVYTIHFYNNNSREYTDLAITAKYGAAIGDKWPTYNSSSTWSTSSGGSTYQVNIDTMPLNGASFYGPKTGRNSETAYYYVEVLPGESGTTTTGGVSYKLHHSDTSPGSGYTVTVEDQYPITGFTFNSGVSTSTGGRYNNAKFYYTRNTYNIIYMNGGSEVTSYRESVLYEQAIPASANKAAPTPPVGKEDYIFLGWYDDPAGQQLHNFSGTMGPQNITVYAYWVAPTVGGVAYITMEGTGGQELTIPYGGTIDESTLPTPQMPEGDGWTFVGWATKEGDTYIPFNFGTKIYSSIELYPYFTNKNSYTVTYTDGSTSVEDTKHYAPGAYADVQPNTFPVPDGKVFLGWAETADGAVKYQPNDKLRMDASVTLYAVWGDTEGVLSLVYMPNGGVENAVTKEQIPNNSKVTLEGAIFTRPGYTLTGWNTAADGSGTGFALGASARVTRIPSNVLFAQWKANDDTPYKVEFYYEQTDGTYKLTKTDERPGTTDSTVSVTEADKTSGSESYVFEADNANNVLSGVVAADGSLTLRVYFKLNTSTYTFYHYLAGTNVKVAEDTVGTAVIGTTVEGVPATEFFAGFENARFSSIAPGTAVTITASPEENVLRLYYDFALTITADSGSKVYDGAPLTAPGFTVEGLVNGDTAEDFTLSMTKESTITNVGKTANVINELTIQYKNSFPPSYYVITCEDGELEITKAAEAVVKIAGHTDTVTYNGKEQSVTGYDITSKPDDVTVTLNTAGKDTAKGTDANTYPMGLTAADFTAASPNYEKITIEVTDGWLKIDPVTDKVTVTVTEKSGSAVYDGQEHSVTGYESMTADNTLYDIADVAETPTDNWTAKGTDAGKYPVGIVAGDFKNTSVNFTNVEFIVVDGELEITPAENAVVKIAGNTKTVIYNGTEQTVTGYEITSNPANATVTLVGKAVASGTDADTYPMGLTAADFEASSPNYENVLVEVTDGWLKIDPVSEKVTVTVTEKSGSVVYNGQEQSITGYETMVSDNVLYDIANVAETPTDAWTAKGTNVGKYPVGIVAGDFKNTSKNFTNVEFVVVDGELEITPVTDKVTVTIVEKSDAVTFDGQEHSVTGYESMTSNNALYDVANVAETPTDAWTAKGTYVGTYHVGIESTDFRNTSANFTNVEFVIVDGDLVITPASVAVVKIAGNTKTVTYNGKEQTVTGYEITSNPANATVTLVGKAFASGTDADTYPMGLTAADFTATSPNYKTILIEVTDGWLKIDPISDKVTVTVTEKSGSAVYDGTEHSVTGYETMVSDNTLYDIANVAETPTDKWTAKGTDVGEYPVGIVSGDFKNTSRNFTNVEFVVVDGALTITPVTDKVTVTIVEKSDSVTYDGQEHSVTGYESMTSDNALYDIANVAETPTDAWTAKGTDVGEYPVGIAAGDFKNTSPNFTNVEFVVVDGDLTISPISEKTITVTAASGSKKYDGTPLTNNGYTYTDGVLIPGDVLTAVVEGSAANVGDEGKNVVKSYKVTRGGADVTANYTFTNSVDGKLTILPRTVTLTSETASKEYDGTPLTRPDVSVTGDGFVSGEVTGITATGSVTFVSDGTVENTITYTTGTAFREDNYEITENIGQLSITQRSDVIIITTPSGSRAYNGARLVDYQTTHTGTLAEGERLVVLFPADAGLTDAGTKRNEYASYYVERISDGKDVTANYTFGESVIGTLEVTPVAIELTANSATKAYDGTPLTDSGYTITKGAFVTRSERVDGKFVDVPEGLASVTVEGSQTAVGSSANKITGHELKSNTLAKNYTITYADGELTVTQNEKVITVTANSHTWEYDGQPHSDGGYTVSYDGQIYTAAAGETVTLPTGDVVSATVEGTVTNVADSADDNNVVTAAVITNASGTQTNDQYKTVTLVPGALKITKRGAGEMKVVLTAADNTVVYDGQPHGARLNAAGQIEADTSYTITNLAEGQRVQTVAIDGTETAVGEYPNKLVPNGAVIVDANDTDVTANYEITYLPGTLTITEVTDEVVVTITEASGTVVYDGQEHSVKGYVSMVSSNPLYDATTSVLAVETAAWTAKGTNVGEYPVGIKAADFENTNTSFTNVRFVIVDGALNITPVTDKVTVTVVENSDTVMYDGQEHSVTGYKSMTADNALYDIADVAETPTAAWTAKGTNAGEYPVGIKAEDFKNTSINFTNVEFVIEDGALKIDPITDKVTVTVVENSDTVTYDGAEHSVTGYKSMTADNALYDIADVAETPTEAWTAKGTYVGTYHVGIASGDFRNTSGNFTNVEFVVVDGDLVITPASVAVVKIEGHTKTVTYNGKEQTVTGYEITSNPANATVKLIGKDTAKGTDADTYPMGLTAADFEASSPNYENVLVEVTDGWLKIDPITDKVTVTVTEKSDTVVYDTNEHSITGYKSMTANNALYNTADVAETPTAAWTAKGTNVGEYPVGIEAGDFKNTSVNFTNVEFIVVDGALNITPAESIVVKIAGNTKTGTYNGTEQTVEGYTVTSNPANATVTLVGKAVASGTDADTYPMGLTAADFTATSPNYKKVTIEVTDGWLKIDPISDKVTVTVTENSDTVTYDGKEHTVTGYETMTADNALYDIANVAETKTAAWTAKGTDAGEYPVGIVSGDFKNTSKNFTNVEFVVVDGALNITPVTEKVTVTIVENSDTVVYDTKEHSVTGYKSMTADNALYDVKKNVAETPTEAWTAKGTDVGEYPVGIEASDFENTSRNFTNVEFVIVDGALNITPAENIVVKIAGNTKTVTYNGTEQSVEGYEITSNPANATVTLVGKASASGKDADTYPMGLTAADFTATSPNYKTITIEVTDGWLKIDPVSDKVTVTVTEKSGSVVYNGQEQSITGYETMVSDNILYDIANVAETPTEAWTAKGTNVGEYPVGIVAGDFKNTSRNFTNVEFVVVDGALEITPVTSKVTVTVTEKSGTVTYDAKQHSITGYESMTADNALYDVTKNVAGIRTAAWTAKGVEAGEYPVGIEAGDFKNTSANFTNVEFVIVDGALVIEADDAEVIVTITGNTKTVTYDGTEHSVEGYTVEVNGLPIKVTPKADLEAKASGTNADTYYMGLTADDFTAESNNYSNIKIIVNDGWLKIDPITDRVTVTITEAADTVEYDGKEHSVTGYVSMVSDHDLYDIANVAETPTDKWTAKGTDAGSYPVGIESGDFENTSPNFTNVEFVIVDGELVITRRGENPESPVTLRADDSTLMFDGDYHGYVGHTATNLAEGHSVRSVKSDFTARNVGRYEDKIDLHDAIIVDAGGNDVTRNYVITYLPGTLEITPFEGEVIVTITGNTGIFRYDGMIHTVRGYTWEASVPFFTEDDIRFTGDATISEVRPGDYEMGLKEEDFSAANDNFTSVKFVVIDGSMRIYTVRYTVAWMFDTDQMLTGDSPNRYFTSMANYIDRSDISLVLHTGNVVADAKDQSQWDVYNNAMQPLYDDEDVDVLMIAAEKEAASGSLFLQQPVREDFEEKDLFESGKGFVRRFNIGEKSVILVGLGADAMTEEGYKWAREKFDSDKDASGILLVNTYLLEDMRKPDKIDESALDLEKNVVKACSNVRMVLSSSGGYSSHYEFYYGERKVTAINSDIEAAAKAGYFTQLTFNEDLNILSVTNLCPYTYDFVYNERQAYKECYVLKNVL